MTTKLDAPQPSVAQTFRDESVALIRWTLGMAIILAAGWPLWAAGWYGAKAISLEPAIGLAAAAGLSLFLFLKLEHKFWLSRLMGLSHGPNTMPWSSTPWASAFLLWALNVVIVLLRSSGPSASTAAEPAPATGGKAAVKEEEQGVKDSFREIVETVVFVVVLVLLLKTFVAEAFVIPTGSMAETLLGYQRWVTCAKCGHYFPVNCSSEVDPQHGEPQPVLGCTCPNCRYREVWREFGPNGLRQLKEPPSWSSGDRVLVSKFPYDRGHLGAPDRFDVVVFKYPQAPQQSTVPMNYIKRLIGLPGETIAIYNGDLYVHRTLEYPEKGHPQPASELDTWRDSFTRLNDDVAVRAFQDREKVQGGFEILRRSPEVMLAMRRVVYDNDHPAADLFEAKAKPRWQPADRSDWAAATQNRTYRQPGISDDQWQWLRYRHLLIDRNSTVNRAPEVDVQPSLIRNFMGYNTGGSTSRGDTNWVSDLMLECTVDVEEARGEFAIELCKSADKFQARFDLRAGKVTLARAGDGKEFATSDKGLTKAGRYRLRFADFDDRLTLWIDDAMPFGDGVNVPATPPVMEHPNNLDPAGIGARKAAKLGVSHLRLWRDTFYTLYPEGATDGVTTRRVHPGHYLCLGDNSSESSDSRYWGLVPERLLLGRALVVYYPIPRVGLIR